MVYKNNPDFLKANPPAPEHLELLRGMQILAETGDAEMEEILKEMKEKGILPQDIWQE